jgi:ElaB/YqjD/DUF883 family membrane-anchored ribosome-binding protein
MSEMSTDKLATDLKTVARDAEELLRATAGVAGEKAHDARERLKVALESAKGSLYKVEEKAIAGAKVADKTIRDHPYESIGVAFGLGLLIGVLVSRR